MKLLLAIAVVMAASISAMADDTQGGVDSLKPGPKSGPVVDEYRQPQQSGVRIDDLVPTAKTSQVPQNCEVPTQASKPEPTEQRSYQPHRCPTPTCNHKPSTTIVNKTVVNRITKRVSGNYATPADIKRQQAEIDGLRKSIIWIKGQMVTRPELKGELKKFREELAHKIAAQNAAIVQPQTLLLAVPPTIGHPSSTTNLAGASPATTNPTAGENRAEENGMNIFLILFICALVIAAGITIGWWWGHGVRRWGLTDENRTQSAAFDPQAQPNGWGYFRTETTRGRSVLEAKDKDVLIAENTAKSEIAHAQMMAAAARAKVRAQERETMWQQSFGEPPP